MFIYIDESGTFVHTTNPNAWSCVAALVITETQNRKLESVFRNFKVSIGVPYDNEIKLKNLTETQYLRLLGLILEVQGLLFCTAIDASEDEVYLKRHFETQKSKLEANASRFKYDLARSQFLERVDVFNKLPLQLYIQLVCQFNLVSDILNRGNLYLVQRQPSALANFRWRIDQKHQGSSVFDYAFSELAPLFLESISAKDPSIHLVGADYSHYKKFELEEGMPAKIKGYEVPWTDGSDVGKIMRTDMAFMDSKKSFGIQVVDLLVSGLRKCLKGEFSDNIRIASAIGALMIGNSKEKYPINLIRLGHDKNADEYLKPIIHRLIKSAKPILAKHDSSHLRGMSDKKPL